MTQFDWIVFIYKVPSEPTKYRATIWREIKRLGGLYLQNGVCVFPDIDDVVLNVASLAGLVKEFEGTEYTFVTKSLAGHQTSSLIASFHAARDEEYAPLLEECDALFEMLADGLGLDAKMSVIQERYKKLKKSCAPIKARDYFTSPSGVLLTEKLEALRHRMANRTRGEDES